MNVSCVKRGLFMNVDYYIISDCYMNGSCVKHGLLYEC